MSRRRIFAPSIAILVVLTFAVGCGSSDSSDAGESDAKTTTTAEPGAGGSTETTAAGGGGSTTTTADGEDADAEGGGDDDIELTGDFCDMARQLETVGDDVFGEETTDTTPEALLASIQDLFRTLDLVYGQLNQDPPAEIAEEIGVLADFASSNYEQVKDMTSYEDATAVAQSAFGEDTESDEFQAASDKIGAYVEKECGIAQE